MSSEPTTEDADVVDGTAIELRHDEPARTQSTSLSITPSIGADDLVERLERIADAQHRAMIRDVDYGVIPGTNKPTLLKPGAEKLGVMFKLDVELHNDERWDGDHLTVKSRAVVYHAETGLRLGSGEGMCSTREKKYAVRRQDRVCPQCGQPAVIKGKAEYGGGWLCFKKKGGCGAKWPDGDAAIESQPTGDVPNPDLPDTWNTVLKMAGKRARIDAILAVTGASALFTQDMEDAGDASEHHDEPSAASTTEVPADGFRGGDAKPTVKQLGFLKKILDGKAGNVAKPSRAHLDELAAQVGVVVEAGWVDRLNRRECSALLDKLTKEGPPDVPDKPDWFPDPATDGPTHLGGDEPLTLDGEAKP